MKRLYLSIIVMCLAGCASVDKATYIPSSNFNVVQVGSTQVQINKSFAYVSELNLDNHSDNIDDRHGSDVKITSHLFVDASLGNSKIRRGIIITESRLLNSNHYYRTEPTFTVGAGFIEKGFTSDLGGRCGYLIKRISGLHPTTLKLLTEKGYSLDTGIKNINEITFSKNLNRRWLTVFYYESNAAIVDASKHIKITE
jgi:hypothetical protein